MRALRWMVACVLAGGVASAQDDLQVTLLGTGNPRPSMERWGPSTLVEAGETVFLLDAGRGATQRLFQIGSAEKLREIDRIFLTHLHSDHLVGLSDFWMTGWIFGRDRPLVVTGPPGTEAFCSHLEQAFAFDRKVRSQAEQFHPRGVVLDSENVEPGVIFESDGVKITAFTVEHGGNIEPAYGYRVEYRDRSVAFSGDTRYYEPIVEHARGVDVLVHEVISPEVEFRTAKVVAEGAIEQIISHHASPEQVGKIFAAVKPRLAVYSHIVPSPAQPEDLIPPTRRHYQGRLAVGYDLMTIRIGETIEVFPRKTVPDP